ncbi:putative cyclopropane fatty acid synthase domain protein [Mycobacterium xenopi 3993]|nr:putative cyclopropane fatty acid synthase domain protein [Mycobacterium xenopi 3993]
MVATSSRGTAMNVTVSRPRPPAIDARRWPAVAKVPSGLLAAAGGAIAEWLLRRAAAELPLRLVYPDGTVVGAGDAASPALVIARPDRFARRSAATDSLASASPTWPASGTPTTSVGC